MTILFALRDDLTAEMLEYDLPPMEAAEAMLEEIDGDIVRAVYDITSGTPVQLAVEESWEHYRARIRSFRCGWTTPWSSRKPRRRRRRP